jgi:Type I phosphodiesterase / nucleotide pyrophosphatase
MVLRRTAAILAALALCAACALPSAVAVTSAASPSPPPAASATNAPSRTPPPTFTPLPSRTPSPLAARVLIITVDGLRADALYRVNMPVLAGLMQRGASSLSAQTILPSATLMAHASILSASCPAKHAITWNDYLPAMGETRAVTIFDLVHARGGRTVMVVGKEKIIQAVHRSSIDVFEYVNGHDRDVAARAVEEMSKGFEAMLVHLPVVDGIGHTYGWMSPQQVSVIERADAAVGTLLEALDASGLAGSTLVIVTADHGGHGLTHGSDRPEDMTVPWILAGPGVVPGLRLEAPISVMDSAATAAWALGLARPAEWDGRAVEEAFGVPVDLTAIPAPNAACAP